MSKNYKLQLNLIPLAWPILIEGLTGRLVSFTDTFFLSKISDEVASSVGMLHAVLLIGYWVLPQFAVAGTSIASQYIGAKKNSHVVPTYVSALIISILLGSFLSIFLFVFHDQIGTWLGMNETLNGYTAEYLYVLAINFVFVGLRFSYASILASKTLTHWNMVATVTTNLLNIFLNWAFLTGFWIFPEMGIAGIALATVISYAAGFLILAFMVHGYLKISLFKKIKFHTIKEVIAPILKLGIPSALEPFSYTFQNLIISVFIIKLGVIAMSANTYVHRLIFIDLTVSWSLTNAGQIIISHRLGAGKIDEVNRMYWKVALYSFVFALCNLMLYVVFYKTFLSIFTSDIAIINVGFWILVICLFMEPIRSLNILAGVILKTVGDGKFSVSMGLIFMWGLIPFVWIATDMGLGIIGIWACMLADETIRAIVNTYRWHQGKWKTMTVIKQQVETAIEINEADLY